MTDSNCLEYVAYCNNDDSGKSATSGPACTMGLISGSGGNLENFIWSHVTQEILFSAARRVPPAVVVPPDPGRRRRPHRVGHRLLHLLPLLLPLQLLPGRRGTGILSELFDLHNFQVESTDSQYYKFDQPWAWVPPSLHNRYDFW